MTDARLYLAIGLPTVTVLIGIGMNAGYFVALNGRMTRIEERLESRKLWIDFHGIELTAIPLDPRRMVGEPCVPLGGVGDGLGEQAPDFGRGHTDGDPDAALTFELVRNGR